MSPAVRKQPWLIKSSRFILLNQSWKLNPKSLLYVVSIIQSLNNNEKKKKRKFSFIYIFLGGGKMISFILFWFFTALQRQNKEIQDLTWFNKNTNQTKENQQKKHEMARQDTERWRTIKLDRPSTNLEIHISSKFPRVNTILGQSLKLKIKRYLHLLEDIYNLNLQKGKWKRRPFIKPSKLSATFRRWTKNVALPEAGKSEKLPLTNKPTVQENSLQSNSPWRERKLNMSPWLAETSRQQPQPRLTPQMKGSCTTWATHKRLSIERATEETK